MLVWSSVSQYTWYTVCQMLLYVPNCDGIYLSRNVLKLIWENHEMAREYLCYTGISKHGDTKDEWYDKSSINTPYIKKYKKLSFYCLRNTSTTKVFSYSYIHIECGMWD